MLRIKYYHSTPNFGDTLNAYIFEQLLSIPVQAVAEPYDAEPHLIFIGSMIRIATPNSFVWGAGLIDEIRLPIIPPLGFGCVRGPLTKRRLIHHGLIKSGQHVVLGDPALLLSFLSNERPRSNPRYDIGIIPHYVDKTSVTGSQFFGPFSAGWKKWFSRPENINIGSEINFDDIKAKLIDVQCDSCETIIQQMCDCSFIASSSLHGLIVADALGIPNTWIKMSDKLDGGAFKFVDYMMSVERYDVNPLILTSSRLTKAFLERAIERKHQWSMHFDMATYKSAFEGFLASDSFRLCCD